MIITEEVLWLGALVTLIFGGLIGLVRLQNWAARQIRKNKVIVVVYKDGKKHKYSFSSIRDAAANTIERIANGEGVSHMEQHGEKIWDAFSKNNKYSLVKLAAPKRHYLPFRSYY